MFWKGFWVRKPSFGNHWVSLTPGCWTHLTGVVGGDDLQIVSSPHDPAPLETRQNDFFRLTLHHFLGILLAHLWKIGSLVFFQSFLFFFDDFQKFFFFFRIRHFFLFGYFAVQSVAQQFFLLIKNIKYNGFFYSSCIFWLII